MNRKIAVWTAATAALLLAAPHAFAQTAAGTKVTNTANVTYKIGAVTQTAPPAGTADFFVDRKVDLTVSSGSYTTGVAPGSTNQAVSFVVTNNTNDVIDIALTPSNKAAGTVYKNANLASNTDDKTGTELGNMTYKLYVNDSASAPGTYGGDNTELTKDGGGQYFIDNIAAGDNQTIFVVAQTMPAAGPTAGDTATDNLVQDGDIIVVDLTGVAHSGYDDQHGAYNSGTGNLDWVVDTSGNTLGDALTNDAATTDDATVVDNVFADSADDDSADAANNGQDGSYAAYEIGGADITVTKRSVVYWDPIVLFGDGTHKPKAIPGARVLYCITVKNAGTATADSIKISDGLDVTHLEFDDGSDLDGDSGNGVQSLDPDGAGALPALDSTNSIRFSSADSCTTTDWDDASAAVPPAGSSMEDSDGSDGGDSDGAIGDYNVTTADALTTTVTSLPGDTDGAAAGDDPGYTTAMFLVEVK